MDKPLEFDEIIHGQRVTVIHGPTLRSAGHPLEAPYDVSEKQFEGGRDVGPLPNDNALARFALGMPPASCSRDEYTELKQEARSIGDQIKALTTRLQYLEVRMHSFEHKAQQ